jgi:hypothetical protein
MKADGGRTRAERLTAAVVRIWWPDGGLGGVRTGERRPPGLPDQSRRALGVAHRLAVRTLRRDWDSAAARIVELSPEECAVVFTRLHCMGLGLLDWPTRSLPDRVAIATAAMLLGEDLTMPLLRACATRSRRPVSIREGASVLRGVFAMSSEAVLSTRSPILYLPELLAGLHDDAMQGAVAASVGWYSGVLRIADPGPDSAIADREESVLQRFLHPDATRTQS